MKGNFHVRFQGECGRGNPPALTRLVEGAGRFWKVTHTLTVCLHHPAVTSSNHTVTVSNSPPLRALRSLL